jgi:hypothetical protein
MASKKEWRNDTAAPELYFHQSLVICNRLTGFYGDRGETVVTAQQSGATANVLFSHRISHILFNIC